MEDVKNNSVFLEKNGYYFNGDVGQEQREVIMNLYKRNIVRVIYATDVAARGIDI